MLEARYVHFVIVCCGVMHHCSHTAHTCIHDDKLVTRYKDVSEHHRDCNGNSSVHVQGRQQLDLGIWSMYIIQHLPTRIMIVIHTRMRITGRFKGYFPSVHLSATGLKLLALFQFAPKTFETNELEHEVPCHREATQANRDSGCLALCTL